MNTKELRQKILDLAIHGKLVPQDPNDEPASVLLERIKAEKERLIKEGKIKRAKKSAKFSDTPHYGNVPFEVPNGWVWCKLGDIFQHNNGKQKTSSNQNGKLLKYITTSNVYWGRFDLSEIKEMRFLESELAKCTAKRGDLLVCEGGDIGRAAIWDYDQIICFQNHLHRLRGFVPICTKYFLFSLMFCKIKGLIKGKGIGLMTLSANDLHNIPIPLPPLAEQQRIVTEVDRWFALIDQIEQSQSDLQVIIKNTKNKILDLAIHGRLVPQDPNDEPASELLKRINPKAEITCDNGHYPFVIPSIWIWHKIGTVAQVITGSTPSKSIPDYYGGSFPFYKPSDLDAGRHVVQSSEYLSEKGKSVSKIIPSNSIAICCIGSIGKIGYIEKEGTTNQQINTILPRKTILNPLYCYYVCSSSFFVSQLIDLSSAITISIVNKSRLQSTDIPLPPISEQQRIVAKIEELFSILDNIQKSLEA